VKRVGLGSSGSSSSVQGGWPPPLELRVLRSCLDGCLGHRLEGDFGQHPASELEASTLLGARIWLNRATIRQATQTVRTDQDVAQSHGSTSRRMILPVAPRSQREVAQPSGSPTPAWLAAVAPGGRCDHAAHRSLLAGQAHVLEKVVDVALHLTTGLLLQFGVIAPQRSHHVVDQGGGLGGIQLATG